MGFERKQPQEGMPEEPTQSPLIEAMEIAKELAKLANLDAQVRGVKADSPVIPFASCPEFQNRPGSVRYENGFFFFSIPNEDPFQPPAIFFSLGLPGMGIQRFEPGVDDGTHNN